MCVYYALGCIVSVNRIAEQSVFKPRLAPKLCVWLTILNYHNRDRGLANGYAGSLHSKP